MAALALIFAGFVIAGTLFRGAGTFAARESAQADILRGGNGTDTAQNLPLEIRPLDVNSASAEELMSLPGIGEALAARIVEYRAAHGDFEDKDALMRVEGIGEARLAAISDYITIGRADAADTQGGRE